MTGVEIAALILLGVNALVGFGIIISNLFKAKCMTDEVLAELMDQQYYNDVHQSALAVIELMIMDGSILDLGDLPPELQAYLRLASPPELEQVERLMRKYGKSIGVEIE